MSNLDSTNTKPLSLESRPATMVRPILPQNIEDAFRLAKAFALADMLPKSYTGDLDQKSSKAFTAMQLGAELGMMPMQSIQSIAVVNGMPTIWGDAQKGLVMASGLCEYIRETYEGEPYNDDYRAVCIVKRKGQQEIREEFSVADAKKAGLWTKSGTWQTHPKRMLRYKVRSFALRDEFSDILKGLHSVEELEGLEDVTPPAIKLSKERKLSTEVNNIIANNEVKEERPINISALQLNDAARKRMENMQLQISNTGSAEELQQFIQENEVNINMLPNGFNAEIYKTITTHKEKLGIPPENDLFGG